MFSIDFTGKTLDLRSFLRTENVSSFAGLWIRQDGDGSPLSIDNMQSQSLKRTSEWKEYSVRLPLLANADRLVIGVLLSGTGKVWADANAAMLEWTKQLGQVTPCTDCASLPETGVVLRPALNWLGDEKLLVKELSGTLQSVYKNRVKSTKQFFASLAFGVSNPGFDHELGYK